MTISNSAHTVPPLLSVILLGVMKKILGKLTKRSQSVDAGASGVVPPATQPLTARVSSKRLGLICLAESTPGLGDCEQYSVDIIAVHGLNGDSYTTWTHENGTLWLKDFLPSSLPGCRVFTYGYPSELFSSSVAEVKGYARRLLGSIRDVQDSASNQVPLLTHFWAKLPLPIELTSRNR